MTAEPIQHSKRRSWTRDLVIRTIQDRQRQGLALNPQLLQQEDTSLLAAGRRYFGSWPKALRAANVPPIRRMASKRHHRGYWTRELLTAEIRRHAAMGHPLYAHAMQQLDNCLVSAATYHFGSWSNALEQSGFDPDSIRANRRHSPHSVAQEIQHLLIEQADIDDAVVRTHYRTLYWAARKYFGTWHNAVAFTQEALMAHGSSQRKPASPA